MCCINCIRINICVGIIFLQLHFMYHDVADAMQRQRLITKITYNLLVYHRESKVRLPTVSLLITQSKGTNEFGLIEYSDVYMSIILVKRRQDPHVLTRRFFAGGQWADVETLVFPRHIKDMPPKRYSAHCMRECL